MSVPGIGPSLSRHGILFSALLLILLTGMSSLASRTTHSVAKKGNLGFVNMLDNTDKFSSSVYEDISNTQEDVSIMEGNNLKRHSLLSSKPRDDRAHYTLSQSNRVIIEEGENEFLISASPTLSTTTTPSVTASGSPSALPSTSPSLLPSALPSESPSALPSGPPSASPSGSPSTLPSASPSTSPTASPSISPSALPTGIPSLLPSASPSTSPSELPSGSPSAAPAAAPSALPSETPSLLPSALPSSSPSASPSVSSSPERIQEERRVLQKLFVATGGEEWNNNSGWIDEEEIGWIDDEEIDHCGWYGVTCSRDLVTELDLRENNLIGSIPAEIGKLIQLQKIIFHTNSLSGSIPTEICELTRLQELDLQFNNLAESIPSEVGKLRSLTELFLSLTSLTGSIPSEVGMMSRLKTLGLKDNDLTGPIPSEVGQMFQLQFFDLYNNSLTGSIPSEVGQMAWLQNIKLGTNKLIGSIPTEIGNLGRLLRLNLRNNSLTGSIPSEVGNLARLYELNLGTNNLNGSIPSEVGNLVKLADFFLDSTNLVGSIPTEVGEMALLWRIHINNNSIAGPIPTELGKMTKIREVHLNDNILTGPLPTEVGYLTKIKSLLLDSNRLTGSIPSEIGRATRLNKIDISMNNFNGSLPSQLSLAPLKSFNASYNSITSFPLKEKWSSLQICDLSNNQIRQSFSVDISGLYSMQKLILSNNFFNGPIPGTLGSLVRIEELYVDNNELVGTIPDDIVSLIRLRELKLSRNRHVKCFHNTDCGGTDTFSYRQGDEICCRYGDEQRCSYNVERKGPNFCLSFGLSGTIPASFGDVPYLQVLDLSSNYLEGEIPPEIGGLKRLDLLDLSVNMLSGSLPAALGELTTTTILLKGNAQFDDEFTTDTVLSKDQRNIAPLSLCMRVPGFEFFNDTTWCPPERNSLRKFYEEAKGQEWTNNTGWSDEYDDYCSWYGVECNDGRKVTSLELNNNGLSGQISSHIGNIASLGKLDLQDNDLKGSIPSEMGKLKYLSYVRLSYNAITGEVPSEFSTLSNLELFHLHGNRLSGIVPVLASEGQHESSFITDCGSPSIYEDTLACPSCTMCCNSMNECDVQEKQTNFKTLSVISMVLVFPFFFVVGIIFFFAKRVWDSRTKIPCFLHPILSNLCGFPLDEYETVGEESVYNFFLTTSLTGWLIAFFVLFIQAISFGLFIDAATLSFDNEKEWVYSYVCPINSEECRDTSDVTYMGWLFFAVYVGVHTMTDLARGLRMLYMCVSRRELSPRNLRCFISGVLIFSITCLAIYATAVFNMAISRSNIDLIVNTIVILFVTDVDERMHEFLGILCPLWLERKKRGIEQAFSADPTKAITLDKFNDEGLEPEIDEQSVNDLEQEKDKGNELANKVENLEKVVNDLIEAHTQEINDLKKDHAAEVAGIKDEFVYCMCKLRDDFDKKIADLQDRNKPFWQKK